MYVDSECVAGVFCPDPQCSALCVIRLGQRRAAGVVVRCLYNFEQAVQQAIAAAH